MKDLKKLRKIAVAADKVATNWRLDKEDTYIAAEMVPPQPSDWYWLTGEITTPETSYEAGASDEDYRGPKKVVQAYCRHMVAFQPKVVLALMDELIAVRQRAAHALSGAIQEIKMGYDIADDFNARDEADVEGGEEFLAGLKAELAFLKGEENDKVRSNDVQ
jgi:hypothetical protein